MPSVIKVIYKGRKHILIGKRIGIKEHPLEINSLALLFAQSLKGRGVASGLPDTVVVSKMGDCREQWHISYFRGLPKAMKKIIMAYENPVSCPIMTRYPGLYLTLGCPIHGCCFASVRCFSSRPGNNWNTTHLYPPRGF